MECFNVAQTIHNLEIQVKTLQKIKVERDMLQQTLEQENDKF